MFLKIILVIVAFEVIALAGMLGFLLAAHLCGKNGNRVLENHFFLVSETFNRIMISLSASYSVFVIVWIALGGSLQ